MLLFMRLFIFIIAICAPQFSFAKSKTIQDMGDLFRYASPIAAGIGSLYADDYKGVGQLFLSVFITQGISELSKKAFPKKRPDWEHGCPKNSFPSGHVASTFSAASYLRIRYDEPKYYIPAYAIAAFTAYSRVQARRHHVVDVLAATVVAELVSYFVVDKQNKITITPAEFSSSNHKAFGFLVAFDL
jgi:membrane-associated phospholipid phosphatase